MKVTILTVLAGLTLLASTSNAGTLTTSGKEPAQIYQARTYYSDVKNSEVLELSAVNGASCTVSIDTVKKSGLEVSSLITLLASSTKVNIRCYPETEAMPAEFGIIAEFK